MREHKYRAWNKVDKKIHQVMEITYWYLEADANLTLHGCKLSSEGGPWYENYVLAKDLELMQYIGLKDCKGQEIYEGDIVRISNNVYKVNSESYKKVNKPHVVVWCTDSFSLNDVQGGCYDNGEYEDSWFIDWGHCEVIGNIYEHPQLLKEG